MTPIRVYSHEIHLRSFSTFLLSATPKAIIPSMIPRKRRQLRARDISEIRPSQSNPGIFKGMVMPKKLTKMLRNTLKTPCSLCSHAQPDIMVCGKVISAIVFVGIVTNMFISARWLDIALKRYVVPCCVLRDPVIDESIFQCQKNHWCVFSPVALYRQMNKAVKASTQTTVQGVPSEAEVGWHGPGQRNSRNLPHESVYICFQPPR